MYIPTLVLTTLLFFLITVNFVESFAFGSLISAVDPVATVAIFHAIDVDPVLNMLVFGESILNGEYFINDMLISISPSKLCMRHITMQEYHAFFQP